MKKTFGWVALPVGMVTGVNVQVDDTIQWATGNDLYQGIIRKPLYWQTVTPHGVQVTLAKTVHIIFPSAVRYMDLRSNWIIAGKADGAENVIRMKAATEGLPGETNFSVICEDGSFYSFNARYAYELETLNIETKDLLENRDTTGFSHTCMNIHFRELIGESPLLVKLIIQSIYKENRREIRYLGCKRFGVQFLLKSAHLHNGLFYFRMETRNRSNVTFRTDFVRFKIVDKKVPKCTATQKRVTDPMRNYNEVLVTEGESDARMVYAVPQFTIPDNKLLVIDPFEKDGGRHQTIRVENTDPVAVRQTNELRIKQATKRLLFIVLLLGVRLHVSQAHAQRCLPGTRGIQLTGGLLDNMRWKDGGGLGYHAEITVSIYTKSVRHRAVGAEYLEKRYGYRDCLHPASQSAGEGGYYLNFLSDRKEMLFAALGLSVLAGYETVNWGESLLSDGSWLADEDNFIYGGMPTLELPAYVADKTVLLVSGR